MTEKHVILLSPTSMGSPVGESVKVMAECGHECWIAPSGLALTLDPGTPTETRCLNCVPRETLRKMIAGVHGQVRAIPGAKEEIDDYLGKGAADAMYRRYNVKELGDGE